VRWRQTALRPDDLDSIRRVTPCSAGACDTLIPGDRLLCHTHWIAVPIDVRRGYQAARDALDTNHHPTLADLSRAREATIRAAETFTAPPRETHHA